MKILYEYIGGLGDILIDFAYFKKYKEKLVAKDIFLKSRRNSSKEKAFVKDFLDKLGLIAVAPAGANVNETFASVLNGYQYILTEYANAVDLLPRLERFKQTFKC